MNRWVRPYRLTPMPRVRLVCLAHAGGSASFFRDWASGLPGDIDVLAVQYPGREERFAEPCATRMNQWVKPIVQALGFYADRPLALFGHSLGALVAHEVAQALTDEGLAPQALFVSAHPAPDCQRPGALHQACDHSLLADVRRQSGEGQAQLTDPAMQAVFLPALRADYELLETWRGTAQAPLPCPVHALSACDDSEADATEISAWQGTTRLPLQTRQFPGGHFYLVEHRQAVLDEVARQLKTPGFKPLKEHSQ